MNNISWLDGQPPQIEIGQKIYYIEWEDNCPAAMTQRWKETTVRSYHCKAFTEKQMNLVSGDGIVVMVMGVETDSIIFDRSEDALIKPYLSPWEIYLDEKSVKHDARWYPLNLTDQEWMNLHGTREANEEEEENRKKHWDEKHLKAREIEKEIEKLRIQKQKISEPWIHHLEAESVSIDECELGPCCANISEVRDMLMDASAYGGIIYRNVRRITDNLLNSHPEWLRKDRETPSWNKIMKQLAKPIKEAKSEK